MRERSKKWKSQSDRIKIFLISAATFRTCFSLRSFPFLLSFRMRFSKRFLDTFFLYWTGNTFFISFFSVDFIYFFSKKYFFRYHLLQWKLNKHSRQFLNSYSFLLMDHSWTYYSSLLYDSQGFKHFFDFLIVEINEKCSSVPTHLQILLWVVKR